MATGFALLLGSFQGPSSLSRFGGRSTGAFAVFRPLEFSQLKTVEEMLEHSRHFHRDHVCLLRWAGELHHDFASADILEEAAQPFDGSLRRFEIAVANLPVSLRNNLRQPRQVVAVLRLIAFGYPNTIMASYLR